MTGSNYSTLRCTVVDSGDSTGKEQYCKSSLLLVPEEDRLIVPKAYSSFEEYQEKCCDSGDSDEEKKACCQRHEEEQGWHVPLASYAFPPTMEGVFSTWGLSAQMVASQKL
jgi:hypothetical protein